ncbi:hypothetical protein FH972_022542 [Carpinus fangiana]|uniref:Succinate dehydrogenase assembly factor 2, mitochondrial n=1 Tax=Carpinus fangiana TaxID=176857 RepID=A0A5N6KT79_9ROSI|nr:hypothetical protein FH972_022542 [Carpinus fangiana]
MGLPSRLFRRIPRNMTSIRGLTTSQRSFQESVPLNSRSNDTAQKHREFMLRKPLNPHMTNTNSTIANAFPSVGADKPPADMLTSVDPNFTPKDSVPENTQRMVGGTQASAPRNGPNAELDVGEIEGSKVKIEPLKRQGESEDTIRARLTYQSRKRGTLESDLLLSTFADAHLGHMTYSQMQSYDTFLDENDWDIYYWATQTPPPISHEIAEGVSHMPAAPAVAGATQARKRGRPSKQKEGEIDQTELARAVESGKVAEEATARASNPTKTEWANTIGTFKPAYRPVPLRWKNSEILALLRKHVMNRSAGGVHEGGDVKTEGKALFGGTQGNGGGGLGMMPPLKDFRGAARSS